MSHQPFFLVRFNERVNARSAFVVRHKSDWLVGPDKPLVQILPEELIVREYQPDPNGGPQDIRSFWVKIESHAVCEEWSEEHPVHTLFPTRSLNLVEAAEIIVHVYPTTIYVRKNRTARELGYRHHSLPDHIKAMLREEFPVLNVMDFVEKATS